MHTRVRPDRHAAHPISAHSRWPAQQQERIRAWLWGLNPDCQCMLQLKLVTVDRMPMSVAVQKLLALLHPSRMILGVRLFQKNGSKRREDEILWVLFCKQGLAAQVGACHYRNYCQQQKTFAFSTGSKNVPVRRFFLIFLECLSA